MHRKYLPLILLSALLIQACNTGETNSIQLGVNNTVEIPVECVKLQITIGERGEIASETEESGYNKLAAVVTVLQDAGLPEDAIEITAGDLNRVPNDNTYQFNSTVRFDLADPDLIDTVRRAVISAGGTGFRVIGYGNAEEEEIFDRAYRNSIDVARERAERLVSDQDVRVGRILNLHENIREIVRTPQMDGSVNIDISGALDFGTSTVESMFRKETYNRSIEFNIEFELVEK
ncbi:MAG: SIMPL domain-containing protein [Balneolaceae bacterium]|nr:SIMPL domain-containing protein [Balneolaceae bacterium]MCH8548017.1 SIMPL domain-containing protein [Balneolaceae bacterium]